MTSYIPSQRARKWASVSLELAGTGSKGQTVTPCYQGRASEGSREPAAPTHTCCCCTAESRRSFMTLLFWSYFSCRHTLVAAPVSQCDPAGPSRVIIWPDFNTVLLTNLSRDKAVKSQLSYSDLDLWGAGCTRSSVKVKLKAQQSEGSEIWPIPWGSGGGQERSQGLNPQPTSLRADTTTRPLSWYHLVI